MLVVLPGDIQDAADVRPTSYKVLSYTYKSNDDVMVITMRCGRFKNQNCAKPFIRACDLDKLNTNDRLQHECETEWDASLYVVML